MRVLRDAAGQGVGLCGVTLDIGARKEHEERVRIGQRRLEEAERIARLGHWTWEVAEDRMLWSAELYRLFGIDPGAVPAFRVTELVEWIHPEERKILSKLVARSVRRGDSFQYQARLLPPDGTARVVEIRATPELGPDGVVVRLLGTAQDVTEHRRTEEALRQAQKMEAVGRLAGGIAHDFNNLLTAIMGFTELLLLTTSTERDPRRRFASEIQRAGDRAAALTRQLLAFSRKQVLQPQVLDLNAVVAEMREDAAAPDRRGHGAGVTDPAPRLAAVKADPGQLEQVLLNLAVNARDAMPTRRAAHHRDRATWSWTKPPPPRHPDASRRAATCGSP